MLVLDGIDVDDELRVTIDESRQTALTRHRRDLLEDLEDVLALRVVLASRVELSARRLEVGELDFHDDSTSFPASIAAK